MLFEVILKLVIVNKQKNPIAYLTGTNRILKKILFHFQFSIQHGDKVARALSFHCVPHTHTSPLPLENIKGKSQIHGKYEGREEKKNLRKYPRLPQLK